MRILRIKNISYLQSTSVYIQSILFGIQQLYREGEISVDRLLNVNSIQSKIILWSAMFFIVALSAVIAFSTQGLVNASILLAEYKVEVGAQQNAALVQEKFESPLSTARSFALAISAAQASSQPLTREQVKSMLNEVMLNDPSLLGAWTLWEPNAFDGQDSQFVNSPARVGGETGRMLIL